MRWCGEAFGCNRLNPRLVCKEVNEMKSQVAVHLPPVMCGCPTRPVPAEASVSWTHSPTPSGVPAPRQGPPEDRCK